MVIKTVWVYLCREMEIRLLWIRKFVVVKPFLSEPLGITCYWTQGLAAPREKHFPGHNVLLKFVEPHRTCNAYIGFPSTITFLFIIFTSTTKYPLKEDMSYWQSGFLSGEAYGLTLVLMFLLWGTSPQLDRYCNL